MKISISVIIPVYNSQNTIELCLRGLLAQDRLPEEVIIVDNGSQDKSVALITEVLKEFPPYTKAVIDFECKKGPAAARNKGIAIATGDIIAFLDSDCVPRADWVANISKRFDNDPTLAGVGGVAEGYNPSNSIAKFISSFRYLEKGKTKDNPSILDLIEGYFIPTLNAAYKKEVLLAVGLFNDTYFIGEDVDLYLKTIKKGYKFRVWDEDIMVRHTERDNLFSFMKRIIQYRIAEARIAREHFYKHMAIVLPFRIVVHKDFFLTVYIESLSIPFAAITMLIVSFYCPQKIYYFFLFFILSALIDTLSRLKKTKIRVNIGELFIMSLILILQKILSGLTKIYGSIKYRIIFL